MRQFIVVAAVTGSALVGVATPALAAPPVGVQVSTNDGVSVGVTALNTPLVAASVSNDGTACVGISLEVATCV